jgi:hypothetical protein
MVARRAGRHATRTGETAHHRTDQGALTGFLAEQRAEIGRLEGQHLVALGQQRLDLAHRRAGAQRDDQFFRRIVDDARHA